MTWSNLNVVPGADLSIGASSALPSGEVTGFGVYFERDSSQDRVFFDNFSIDATAIVPEPSTYGVIAGVFAFSALVVCKRNKLGVCKDS